MKNRFFGEIDFFFIDKKKDLAKKNRFCSESDFEIWPSRNCFRKAYYYYFPALRAAKNKTSPSQLAETVLSLKHVPFEKQDVLPISQFSLFIIEDFITHDAHYAI